MNNGENFSQKIGTAIGTGLIAGLAGTFAMTVSQMIEMKITGREGSDTPANAVREVLDIKPVTESKSKKVSNDVHWVYGTNLGVVRGAFSLAGLRGWAATAVHFVSIWGGEMMLLPALRVAPPVTKESPKSIAIDGLHHLVYAVAAGIVFDSINKQKPCERIVKNCTSNKKRKK
ncbi:MAG TPA: hypothetical protein VIJ75_13915 [Hanamia sp.]